MVNKDIQDFSKQHFYIGLDVHKKRWSVSIRTEQLLLKQFSMNPSPDELNNSRAEFYFIR